MKKLRVVILILFAILLFSTNKVLAVSGIAGLKSDKTTVKPNDLITISLNANCDEGLGFIGTKINYDSEVLTLQGKTIDSNWVNYGGDKLELFVNSSDIITNATVCTFIFKVNQNAKAGNTTIETTEIEITDINNNEYTRSKSMVELTINTENSTENNTGNNTGSSNNNTVAPNTQSTENTDSTIKENTANNNLKNNNNRNNTIKQQTEKETKNEITEEKNDIENSNILIAQPEIKENENILTIADSVQNNNIIKNDYIPVITIIFAIMISLIIMLIVLILRKKHLE